MNEQIPPRTAAALEARHQRTKAKVDQVRDAIAGLRRQKVPITTSAVARLASVSRTFLYENEDARNLVSDAVARVTATADKPGMEHHAQTETAWRERALNAEDALKAAHREIHTQRHRIAQLMGQIRDLESQESYWKLVLKKYRPIVALNDVR